ncbi:LysR family transcriptional regulator [Rhizobium sp. LEGMi135b]
MDPRRIQFFFSVIEHGNLSGAAQALRVSQPTLSRHIFAIEEQYKTKLFIRSARGMILTEAGRQLQQGLLNIDRQLRLVKADVESVSLEPTGEVTFGIPPSPRALFGTQLVKAFTAAYPRIIVRVIEETSAQVRDLVSNGSLDVAIINTHEPSHGTISQRLGRERVLLVGPPDAGLNMSKELTVRELAELPLILTTRPNSLRLIIENAFGLQGMLPNVKLEANMLTTISDMVAAGLGYAVLPACGVLHLIENGQVSASPIKGLSVTWLAARPKDRSVGAAAERFYQMVCELGAQQVRDGIWQK